MIVIRAFRLLDHVAVSVSHFTDASPLNEAGNRETRSLAYRTFQDYPDGCAQDVPEVIKTTIDDLAEDCTALGGWDLLV